MAERLVDWRTVRLAAFCKLLIGLTVPWSPFGIWHGGVTSLPTIFQQVLLLLDSSGEIFLHLSQSPILSQKYTLSHCFSASHF
ncbi:hypothetical protein L873DRAFT_1818397 [Choiromyces venosus 120613-1]|uniref:Uncharacterized protein n=1 Tax=Choiromyces venosus 120613-1 TaxID=1336337 RepID=A0A3N4J4M4_9PEZI|nr:hypothetical protein L873DRAFT_1818397 [Choiromyces venosus 120613-1]